LKQLGTRLLVCQDQRTCCTKVFANKVASFYPVGTKVHIIHTTMQHAESNVQSLIDLCVDTMPHQMKGIGNGRQDV
jgi:hypothetical protein